MAVVSISKKTTKEYLVEGVEGKFTRNTVFERRERHSTLCKRPHPTARSWREQHGSAKMATGSAQERLPSQSVADRVQGFISWVL